MGGGGPLAEVQDAAELVRESKMSPGRGTHEESLTPAPLPSPPRSLPSPALLPPLSAYCERMEIGNHFLFASKAKSRLPRVRVARLKQECSFSLHCLPSLASLRQSHFYLTFPEGLGS